MNWGRAQSIRWTLRSTLNCHQGNFFHPDLHAQCIYVSSRWARLTIYSTSMGLPRLCNLFLNLCLLHLSRCPSSRHCEHRTSEKSKDNLATATPPVFANELVCNQGDPGISNFTFPSCLLLQVASENFRHTTVCQHACSRIAIEHVRSREATQAWNGLEEVADSEPVCTQLCLPKPEMETGSKCFPSQAASVVVLPDSANFSWCLGGPWFSREGFECSGLVEGALSKRFTGPWDPGAVQDCRLDCESYTTCWRTNRTVMLLAL